jgi:hypothetical protein
MHDYPRALASINEAYFIYAKHYGKDNHRFLTVYEIRGKLYALMDKLGESMKAFED